MDSNSADSVNLGQQIKDVMQQIVSKTVSNGSTLSITTPNIVASVADFDPSSPPGPSPQDTVKTTIPSGISSTCSDAKVSKVMYQSHIHKDIVPSGFFQTSDSLSLDMYSCGGVKQPVSDLHSNIVMEFPVKGADPALYEEVHSILREGRNPSDQVYCSFRDEATNSISQEGCSLDELTSEYIKCGCNHMTDFLVLVKTDYTGVAVANYGLFKALGELSRSNLRENSGFIFAIVYSILYLFVCLILLFVDKRRKNPNFFSRLFAHITGAKIIEQYEQDLKVEKAKSSLKIRPSKNKVHPSPLPNRGDSTTFIAVN